MLYGLHALPGINPFHLSELVLSLQLHRNVAAQVIQLSHRRVCDHILSCLVGETFSNLWSLLLTITRGAPSKDVLHCSKS